MTTTSGQQCLDSTEKTGFQSGSSALDKATLNWTIEKDTLQESVDDNEGHRFEFGILPYGHRRPLPNDVASKAHQYIAVLVKRYPFQLRYALALPLWDRFCQTWCETGNEAKSLRAI